MTREDFFYQCIDVIEHWLNGNRKLSDLREVTDKLYNEVTRPHWISVDEGSEPPKEHEWIIGFSSKRSYADIYNFDSNGLFEAHGITHWMHLPSIEEIKGNQKKTSPNSNSISIDIFEEATKGFKPYPLFSGRMEKAPKSDHIADVSKKVEKGGEE